MNNDENSKIYTRQVAKELNVTATTVRNYFKDSAFPKPLSEKRGRQKLYYLTPAMLAQYKSIIEEHDKKK